MIRIKAFSFNSFQVNTYVLADEGNDCLIVDPGCSNDKEREELKNFIEEQKLNPVKLVNTHSHLDHIIGNAWVYETYGLMPFVHEAGRVFWESAEEFGKSLSIKVDKMIEPRDFLKDGDKVNFGSSSLKVIYTPGHADGSICLYCKNEHFLISGDVLFRDSIGRTDLPTGDYDLLRESIITKVFNLPEETIVFPGHGPHTTIGYEKKNNPFIYLSN